MILLEEDISEIFKNTFTYYFVLISIILFVAPLSSVDGAHEFQAYRMHQFDFNSVAYGCRSASVNLEVHSLLTWSTARHCIITWLMEMTIDQYKLLSNKAGCVLLILPQQMHALNEEEKTMLLLLEKYMMSIDTLTPTYFAHWSPELDKIATDVNHGLTTTNSKESAVQALINAVAGNRYQLVINVNKPVPTPDLHIASVYGTLAGKSSRGEIERLPTIVIVAHYDTMGIAPELAMGADNNGSGLVALFELVRLFSTLFGQPRSLAPYNLVFLVSGGGKYNYLATKKFLDEEMEEIGRNVDFVLCLEGLASSPDAVNFFVSKPPKPGTPVDRFYQIFSKVAASKQQQQHSTSPNSPLNVTLKHKKINLQDAWLAWEHEHFSMRKYRAFTLSALENHKDIRRNTILDTKHSLDIPTLTRNIEILAESLASYVYNIQDASVIFEASLKVEKASILSHLAHLSHTRRSVQLTPSNSKRNPLVDNFSWMLSKYLKQSGSTTSGGSSPGGAGSVSSSSSAGGGSPVVKTFSFPQDRREPDLVTYTGSGFSSPAHVYTVKPIVFDLVLLAGISLYLYLVYLVIETGVPKFL
uniref:BOS complex subunit NCLN n=1 Tax=Cacopsylla melanoneura TaxID=428564 RepID=A0A8D8ZL71_9HEMI